MTPDVFLHFTLNVTLHVTLTVTLNLTLSVSHGVPVTCDKFRLTENIMDPIVGIMYNLMREKATALHEFTKFGMDKCTCTV